MNNSTPKLVFPQVKYLNNSTESWHYLESPTKRDDKFVLPFEQPRRMWLLIPDNVLAILLKHGWREVV